MTSLDDRQAVRSTPEENEGGFFLCSRCHHVVTPSNQQIAFAENSPIGRLTSVELKCPRCHKWAVRWQPARPERKRKPRPPVSPERATQFFSDLRKQLGFHEPQAPRRSNDLKLSHAGCEPGIASTKNDENSKP